MLALGVLAVSCMVGTPETGYNEDGTLAKIVNAPLCCDNVDGILVKFKDLPDDVDAETVRAAGAEIAGSVFPENGRKSICGLERWYHVIPEKGHSASDVARKLAAKENIETKENDDPFLKVSDCECYPCEEGATKAASSQQVFDDPLLARQWHYRNTGDKSVAESAVAGADINVADVWRKITGGDNTIIVAVIDEGVKYNHPDLAANMWTNPDEREDGADTDGNGYVDDIHGFNFVTNGPLTWDKEKDQGHGTHCAGTIAAVNNNDRGVCGVAGGTGKGDGVRIMSCQILDNSAGGTPSVVAKAIRYAADNGASIISCSFG